MEEEWNPNWIDETNTDDLSELDGVDLSSEIQELSYEEMLKELDFDGDN